MKLSLTIITLITLIAPSISVDKSFVDAFSLRDSFMIRRNSKSRVFFSITGWDFDPFQSIKFAPLKDTDFFAVFFHDVEVNMLIGFRLISKAVKKELVDFLLHTTVFLDHSHMNIEALYYFSPFPRNKLSLAFVVDKSNNRLYYQQKIGIANYIKFLDEGDDKKILLNVYNDENYVLYTGEITEYQMKEIIEFLFKNNLGKFLRKMWVPLRLKH
jgi:hypothetical protein